MFILLGFVVGLMLGIVLHRGDFCMHSAVREALEHRTGPSLRAYLLALAVQLALVNTLSGLGWLRLSFPPVAPLAAVVGGFLFGVGMVLTKG